VTSSRQYDEKLGSDDLLVLLAGSVGLLLGAENPLPELAST
jgi:hypothetical protein